MTTAVRQISAKSEVDDRLAALMGNASAVRSIASAVEGTLGPKGLDCMLVDKFGDVTVTNDGSTILDKVETGHPAARMLINTAKAQEKEVGDGTTTATVLANILVQEGAAQISKGVPTAKVLEGMRLGLRAAAEAVRDSARRVSGLSDPLLHRAAFIAARENADLAELVLKAAHSIGEEKLLNPPFRLGDQVLAKVGAESQVVPGLIIEKQRMSRQMPARQSPAVILVLDDALEPEELDEEALGTEAGLQRYLKLREEFQVALRQLLELGVNVAFISRAVHDLAEELLTEAGVLVARRLTALDLSRITDHTGARPLKRHSLRRPKEELARSLGHAKAVFEDEVLEHLCIVGGNGDAAATVLVGASTAEVRDERHRMARDAAAAIQAALREGVVPGGGAAEIGAVPAVESVRENARGMVAYGVDCVLAALKAPLGQIVANAGFNSLEKIGDVLAEQSKQGNGSLGIDCDTGAVADMFEIGVVDPALVKTTALRAAGEIADAILRINTVIRKKDEAIGQEPAAAP